MIENPRDLFAIAATRCGVFSRDDALAAGFTDRRISTALATGRWERLAPGVYRPAGTPDLPRTPLAVAVVASGGWASHRSAAELLDLHTTLPAQPEIVLPGTAKYRGVTLAHRTTRLPPDDRSVAGGLRCTSVERTLCDLGAVLSEFEVEGIVHRAIRRGLVDVRSLEARFLRFARRGQPGSATMRAVLERLAVTGATESHLELRILRVLRDHGVRLPEPQVEVAVRGRRFRLDFAYRAEQVFLEGDGYGVHSERDTFERDRSRQNALVRAGWLPLRYTDRTLRDAPFAVASEVADVIRRRTPAA